MFSLPLLRAVYLLNGLLIMSLFIGQLVKKSQLLRCISPQKRVDSLHYPRKGLGSLWMSTAHERANKEKKAETQKANNWSWLLVTKCTALAMWTGLAKEVSWKQGLKALAALKIHIDKVLGFLMICRQTAPWQWKLLNAVDWHSSFSFLLSLFFVFVWFSLLS